MLFIVLFAIVMALVFWQIERRWQILPALGNSFQSPAPGAWVETLRAQGPLLLGVHLLIFTAMMFGQRFVNNVFFNVGPAGPTMTSRIYSEWAIDFWIGPAVTGVAFLALVMLLAMSVSERWAYWRGDIVLLAGLLIGAGLIVFRISERSEAFISSATQHYAVIMPDGEIKYVSVLPNIYVMREWQSGWFLDLVPIVLLIASGVLIINYPGVRTGGPHLSRLALWGALAIVLSPLALPIVTMVLGIIAIRQIKRSGGKLYGLRLAAVEALLLPWILIVGAIGGLICAGVFAILNLLDSSSSPNPAHPGDGPLPQGHIAPGIPIIISIIPTLAISFLVCRALWRAVVGRPVRIRPISPAPKISGESGGIGVLSLSLAIAGTVLPILIAAIYMKSSLPMRDLVLCAFLGIVLEIAALGCGIAGRRAPAGKAGLIVSIVALALYVLIPAVAIPFFVAQPHMKPITSSTETTKAESVTPSDTKQVSQPTTRLSSP